MDKFQTGDLVRKIGMTEVGEIVNIVDEIAIVKYPRNRREKIPLNQLFPPIAGTITLTPEKFDLVVKEIMYEAAADYETEYKDNKELLDNMARLDDLLKMIGGICGEVKRRLFDSND